MTFSPRKPRKELKRTEFKKRSGSIARAPMKKRPKSKALMLRTHGTVEHREWIKRQPCVVCGRTPSDAAHLKNGGMGRKDDVTGTVPMCSDVIPAGYSGHHTEYDAGKQSFRAKYPHLNLEQLAVDWAAKFAAEAA